MTRPFVDGGRFQWGVSVDNMWVYAGLPPPKSIIIPHLLLVRLPSGPYAPRGTRQKKAESGTRPSIRIAPLLESDSPSLLASPEGPSGVGPSTDLSELRFLPNRRSIGARRDGETVVRNTRQRRILCRNLALQFKRSGIDFVRAWFQWNFFEREILPGRMQEYRFPLDEFVSQMNKAGVKIAAVLGNGYYRFLPARLDIDKSSEYAKRLVDASREIVRHYRGKVDLWQLENEPNWWLEHFSSDWRRGGVWFDKGISDTILSSLSAVVREEDPATPTMINLEADTARTFFSQYSKYCDILGLDFYPNYTHAGPINVSEVGKLAGEAKRATGLPLMVAETGYPSGPALFGYSEEKQAEYVRAVSKECSSLEMIGALGIWRFSDTYWYSFPFQENSFGLLRRNGAPKIAWGAYCAAIEEFRRG
jgi:hypothetical protein